MFSVSLESLSQVGLVYIQCEESLSISSRVDRSGTWDCHRTLSSTPVSTTVLSRSLLIRFLSCFIIIKLSVKNVLTQCDQGWLSSSVGRCNRTHQGHQGIKFCFPVKDLPRRQVVRINSRISVSDIDKSLIDSLQQEQTLYSLFCVVCIKYPI